MKLLVNPHKIEILEKSKVNEKEIDISKCEFEFAEEITEEYVKEAYFTLNGNTYKKFIVNNECTFPSEVLEEKGMVEIGVVAFLVENDTEIKRYNPSPVYINTLLGSLKDAENSEPITPTDKEVIEQWLDNIDLDAEKVNKTTTVTITKKDGSTKEVQILDGEKGDKGEPGAIKMIIVATLPQTGEGDTIYLVPLDNPESQENNYAEYVYIDDKWELLGKIGIQVDLTDYYTKQEVNNLIPTQLSELEGDSTHRTVTDAEKTTWNGKYDKPISGIPKTDLANDVQTSLGKADTALQEHQDLTDYVKNTDYANSNKGGVVKTGGYGTYIGYENRLACTELSYEVYRNQTKDYFIGKGTLENVITGKGLTTKSYVDGLVGDIATALDTLNGESV